MKIGYVTKIGRAGKSAVRSALLVWLLLAESGCFRPQQFPAEQGLELGGSCYLPLLGPATLGSEISESYRITISPSDSSPFNARIEVDSGHLAVAGLATLGNRGFIITLDGNFFRYEPSPFLALPMPSERFIRLLQLAIWPLDTLKDELRRCGNVRVSEDGAGVRIIRTDDGGEIRVHYLSDRMERLTTVILDSLSGKTVILTRAGNR
jgi:hypothetical protein